MFDSPDAPPWQTIPVLYEDAQLLAVAKPAGMVTHPAYRHPDGTLADAIFARQAARGAERPWLLHRLDRDTSGVILFARTMPARRSLVRQFERRMVRKLYLAVVALYGGAILMRDGSWGELSGPLRRDPADRRRVIVAADGQAATTRYRLLAIAPVGDPGGALTVPAAASAVRGTVDSFGLALVAPQTGRTHQIRAHLATAGAPLLGDATYVPPESPVRALAPRCMLHAWRLAFRYPGTGEPFTIAASPPDDLLAVVLRLGLRDGMAPETLSGAATDVANCLETTPGSDEPTT